jgi:hypothetical protein
LAPIAAPAFIDSFLFGSMIFFSSRALVRYRYLVGRADTLRCCDPTTSAHFVNAMVRAPVPLTSA